MRDVTVVSIQPNPNISDFMKALIDLMPEPLASAYASLPDTILNQSEITIKTLTDPKPQMEAVRTRLWLLIQEKMKRQDTSRIQLSEIAHGIAPLKYIEEIFTRQYFVAWCGIPTLDYNTRINSLLDKGYQRLTEILDFPMKDGAGKIDLKAAGLILQVVKMLDLRTQGNYTERIEQKTVQVNTTMEEAAKYQSDMAKLSLEELNAKIAALEGKDTTVVASEVVTEIIDVSPSDK